MNQVGCEESDSARTNNSCLPNELLFYILSFLPLSSLFKFRCVCKLWNTLFLHPHLSFLHYRHKKCNGLDLDDVNLFKELKELVSGNWDGVYFMTVGRSNQGLLLERTVDSSPWKLRYRVESSVLHQRLAIPNPKNPSLCIALEFVQCNQAVKLVSVYEDDENHSLGYEVLTLGIGSDPSTYCWRVVKVPPHNLQQNISERKRKRIQVFFRLGVAYCISYVETDDDDIDIEEVDILDMVNKSYIGHTTFPRGAGFFSKLSRTNFLDWDGSLSFAELVNDELHVLVLDDYRKLKWAETKRIIKLTFLKPDNKEPLTLFSCVDKSVLFFLRQDKKSLCSYDINTGKLDTSLLLRCYSGERVADLAANLMFRLELSRYQYGAEF